VSTVFCGHTFLCNTVVLGMREEAMHGRPISEQVRVNNEYENTFQEGIVFLARYSICERERGR